MGADVSRTCGPVAMFARMDYRYWWDTMRQVRRKKRPYDVDDHFKRPDQDHDMRLAAICTGLLLSACATTYSPPPDCPGCAVQKSCPAGTILVCEVWMTDRVCDCKPPRVFR